MSEAHDTIAPAATVTALSDALRRQRALTANAQNTAASPRPHDPDTAAETPEHREATERFLRDIRTVKRARFNAHERLNAKHAASVVAFSLAAVFEIALSIYGGFFAASLAPVDQAFLNFASVVTGLMLLVAGLVVGLMSYQQSGQHLQRCAHDLNNLARKLEYERLDAIPDLQAFRRRYHAIIAQCPPNHASVDIALARLGRDADPADTARATWAVRFDIYGLFALISIGYIAMWIVFWFVLRPA